MAPPSVAGAAGRETGASLSSERCVRNRRLRLAITASRRIRLTLARELPILRAMPHVVRTVAVIRFAVSTRRDLLLEILALHHQLRVLVRSNRRFRPCDRLLWLVLRQLWARWRDALVLVQPATVDRWHRDGFHRCWRYRSRRPGRPRIDSACRGLIRRLAIENRLWGPADSRRVTQARDRRLSSGHFGSAPFRSRFVAP
jgi:hypothetical protein